MVKFITLIRRIFWQDKLAFFLINFGFFFNILSFIIFKWQFGNSQTGLILHYNIFFGIDVFGADKLKLFMPSIHAAVIWFLNFILGVILYFQVLEDQAAQSEEKSLERKKNKKEKDYYLDYFDAKLLASYLLWAGGLLLQLILMVYVISVIIVNR